MQDTNSFLRIKNLTKKFGTFTALNDISLEINESEFVCFLGPSGCGKTTLLRAIAGLDIQTYGEVHQAGKDISVLPPTERDFGIVFQSYALFPNLSVEKNIAYGLENRKVGKAARQKRVSELLELVGLPDQGDKYPAQLSGGQQQRIALARAIATSPGLLLLDEPLSALDAKVRVHLRHEIKRLQRKLGVTTIMVTHDQEEALTMADRIVVMNHGVIEQTGTPLEIYREPATTFVAGFIGSMNFITASISATGNIQLGDAALQCLPVAVPSNTKTVQAAVRPEDIIWLEGNNTSDSENVLKASIEEIEFLGSFVRASLKVEGLTLKDNDSNNMLQADFSINLVRRLGLQKGTTGVITIPKDRLRLFADEVQTT
ncbi:MAG: putative 2-aminoethylphosphonate ABC transporter ATP-binding protein [Arenicellales bacterium WSBS_2016_MAG_OTU3]